MTRVLVVNHDIDLADQEVESLRRRGYDVQLCEGPIGARCPIIGGRPCSLAAWADVMVYDAWATGEPDGAVELIDGLRQHHPTVPIVLQATGIEPYWIETTGPLAITPLVGVANGDRLAATIDHALADAAEARAAAFFG
jgi:DNA-binding NtrC family response regulator